MPDGDRFIPYAMIREAIAERRSMTAIYDNYVRHFSPHLLGKDHQSHPAVVGFQYGGGRAGSLPIVGDWCFFLVRGLRQLQTNTDPWSKGCKTGAPAHLLSEVDFSA